MSLGEPPEYTKADELEDLAANAKWGLKYHHTWPTFLDELNDDGMDRTLEFPLPPPLAERLSGAPVFPTVREALAHVACHSVHHRAQVNTRLRELGGEPPWIDLLAWLLHGKPQADWPELGTA